MRIVLIGLLLGLVPCAARADRAADLARIHVEAIGGAKRIEALKSLRATGHVVTGGKQLRFTMLAARPDKVRIETERGGRNLTQGYDGVEPPWEFDSGATPARYRPIAAALAKTFIADAQFDDPLVAPESRGYTLDFAGEMVVDGKKLLRILVTRKFAETFSVLLDDDTFFVVMRVEHRESAGGRRLQLVTHYEDFRPVDGVLLPHTVTLAVDGRVSQQTKIARIESNPAIDASVFSAPKVSVPGVDRP